MNQEAIAGQINAIISKCWADENFKQKLLKNSTDTLKEEGIDIPSDYTVRILENTGKIVNFVLPPNPNAELSDTELEAVAGGKNASLVGRMERGVERMIKRDIESKLELAFHPKKI